MNTQPAYWSEDRTPRDVVRWTAAAILVCGLHAAAGALFLNWHRQTEIGDDADIVSVELAPIDSRPDAVARDAAPAPQTMIESKAAPQPPEKRPPNEMKVEQPLDEMPGTTPLPEVKPPAPVEQAQPPAPRTAEAVRGGAPHVEPSWEATLVRELQRAKRYPRAAQLRNEQGIVLLSFSVDRNGHVLRHGIAKSSGHADLDNEVMAMIMRAELPPFPASMSEQRLDLTVPIRFSLQ
jgi:periplasmic protein TonB